jgi:hypothetical protein
VKKLLYTILTFLAFIAPFEVQAAALELFSTPLYTDVTSYWRLENGNDTKNLRNLTDVSITYQAGQFNNGASFNGTSSRQSTSTIFSGTTGTISFWFKTSDAGDMTMWQQVYNVLEDMIKVQMYAGNIYLTMMNATVTQVHYVTTATYNNGAWHLYSLTMDGTGSKTYIDGSLITPTYDTGNASTVFWFDSMSNDNEVSIGANRSDNLTRGFFNGMIDDNAVFSRALTATEVSNLYNGTFPTSVKKSLIFFE